VLVSDYRKEEGYIVSSMVGRAKPNCRRCTRKHVPDLVALTLLEVVALSATGLEEVGALLGVT
jgi:hypothetical protein